LELQIGTASWLRAGKERDIVRRNDRVGDIGRWRLGGGTQGVMTG